MKIQRTDSSNAAFQQLVAQLDAELSVVDGEEHAFYAQFNKITLIKHVIVVTENEAPVGCGAIKEFDPVSMEVKRMYVPPSLRGKGIAAIVLRELEKWAKELNYTRCVLETGERLPAAIALYKKAGYHIIPNYGQYIGVENSVCFEKTL
jgi:putative acetyltransferase